MCKQTFPGHESDINAVTVKQFDKIITIIFQGNTEVVACIMYTYIDLMRIIITTVLFFKKTRVEGGPFKKKLF